MTTGFIADLHLGPSSSGIDEAATSWLYDAQQFEVVWILGDFFDAWLGDDTPLPNTRAVDALSALTASGTAVHFMHGNRDFLVGEAFARRTGIRVHAQDAIVIDLDTGLPETTQTAPSQRCLLMHGDTLCTRDEAYLRMRTQFRDPAWQQHFLSLPLQERMAQAQRLRSDSREASAQKSHDIMDVTREAVDAVLHEHDVLTLIHGHTHRPADHRPAADHLPGETRRVVLGDWHPSGAEVATYNEREGLLLKTFAH